MSSLHSSNGGLDSKEISIKTEQLTQNNLEYIIENGFSKTSI